MKTQVRTEIAMLAVTVAPYVALVSIWNQLPNQIPTHFDLNGQPDRYSSPVEFTIILGGISLLMYGLFKVLPGLEPLRRVSTAYYQKTRWIMIVFWALFVSFLLGAAYYGWSGEQFVSVIMAGVFLLLAVLGNMMNSIKPNFFIGVRTPWTLSNEDIWRQTHRLASRIWTVGGVLAAILTLFLTGTAKFILTISVIAVLSLVPVLYSFILFKRLSSR